LWRIPKRDLNFVALDKTLESDVFSESKTETNFQVAFSVMKSLTILCEKINRAIFWPFSEGLTLASKIANKLHHQNLHKMAERSEAQSEKRSFASKHQ
jgi:hypothetical protein